ncbi:MAG: FAD-dependent oxidoreductase [Clostridia bacterium]|nr:FAD-dependent oxidoreductase [Clostridia bacterium]
MKEAFKTIYHKADLCVVGGGLSGLCAAVAAARHGARVVLMQERPMLGGNASSEIRMWVCGAHGDNNRETGILEEMMLENLYRNPDCNYSVWDGIMLETVQKEQNITLLLNCSCNDCEMDGSRVRSVTGWQMTTQTWHTVEAEIFADCSGDSVLAPLTGAEYRIGREAREEFDEDIEPEVADSHTMGMSLLIQAREQARPSKFAPPEWAYKYTAETLKNRIPDMTSPMENFWYLELGGMGDSIADSEKMRDELLKVAYGMWDYVKNAPENVEKNKYWALDWMGILPGKRESRRYVGDIIMNQNDVLAGGKFSDVVAYGGWTMDDHDPMGFYGDGHPTTHHNAPSPYGIPYRCLYSKNIENLMFAGRNISVTHAAISSSRVMATCALLGQAMGTAAALAVAERISPREVYNEKIGCVQQMLMDDDCYLPYNRRKVADIVMKACLDSRYDELRNGHDRPLAGNDNGVTVDKGDVIEYRFDEPVYIDKVRLVFDSDLNRKLMGVLPQRNMPCNRPLDMPEVCLPSTLMKQYRIEADDSYGKVHVIADVTENKRRMVRIPVGYEVKSLRLTPIDTWGSKKCHIFSFDFE